MRRSGTGSGGGIGMNKHVDSRAPKIEPRSRGMNPGGVNQLGNHVGDHVTHSGKSTGYRGETLVRGPGYNAPVGPRNMLAQGPGADRDVSKPGGQGRHGPPASGNPPPNMQRHALSND